MKSRVTFSSEGQCFQLQDQFHPELCSVTSLKKKKKKKERRKENQKIASQQITTEIT